MNRKQMLVTILANQQEYYQGVKNLFGSSLIGYWKLNEPNGTTAADSSGNARNGIYNNVTLGEPTIGGGTLSAKFVPASLSFVNIYSAGLASAFNKDEITVQFIMMAQDAAWWNAAASSRQFTLAADGSNRFLMAMGAGTPNTINATWTGGGTSSSRAIATSVTVPFVVTITVSKSNNRMRIYKDAVKQGTDATVTGTWTGALANTTTVIGAASTSGTIPHGGWMSNFWILNREATQEEITSAMPPFNSPVVLESRKPDWTYTTVSPILNSAPEADVLPFIANGSVIYGAGTATGYTGEVVVSGDSTWETVTPIVELPAAAGAVSGMHIVGAWLLVGTMNGYVYRIAVGGSTATEVLHMTTSGALARNWSFASKGDLVFVGEYGAKTTEDNARRVYRSDDAGETWAEVFQIYHGVGAHVHKLLLDPYTDILWVANGDGTPMRLTKLSPPNYNSGVEVFTDMQPTDGIAFQDYFLWAMDSTPLGVMRHIKSDDSKTLVLDLPTQYPALSDTAYSMLQGPDGAVYFSTHPDVTPTKPGAIWKSYAPFTNWDLLTTLQTDGVPTHIAILVAVDNNGFLVSSDTNAVRVNRV